MCQNIRSTLKSYFMGFTKYFGNKDEDDDDNINEDEVSLSFNSTPFLDHAANTLLLIILILLTLGILKGLFGIFTKTIDTWKFDDVQSMKYYKESGRCWKLFLNSVIFFLIPLNSCFKCLRNDDELESDSEMIYYKKAFLSKQFFADDTEQGVQETESLICASKNSLQKYSCSSESIFDTQNFRNLNDQDDLVVDDTEFIVKAINESHESLKLIKGNQEIIHDKNAIAAQIFVKDLLAARSVYRNFRSAIGGVRTNEDEGQAFSIRGYFIPARDTGYKFITSSPLKQHYQISSPSLLVAIFPAIQLNSKAFNCFYEDIIDVFNSNDLSLQPLAPCLNVVAQNSSMYASN